MVLFGELHGGILSFSVRANRCFYELEGYHLFRLPCAGNRRAGKLGCGRSLLQVFAPLRFFKSAQIFETQRRKETASMLYFRLNVIASSSSVFSVSVSPSNENAVTFCRNLKYAPSASIACGSPIIIDEATWDMRISIFWPSAA